MILTFILIVKDISHKLLYIKCKELPLVNTSFENNACIAFTITLINLKTEKVLL